MTGKMNKRPDGQPTSRRGQLEKELVGEITDNVAQMETGKDLVNTAASQRAERGMRMFNINQGWRRRHPARVLHQYNAINKTTESAETVWEKALLHEDERTDIPEEYKPKEHDMVANQMGLVGTALDNFKRSKGRFTRSQPVGV
jgi:hypothetical protein